MSASTSPAVRPPTSLPIATSAPTTSAPTTSAPTERAPAYPTTLPEAHAEIARLDTLLQRIALQGQLYDEDLDGCLTDLVVHAHALDPIAVDAVCRAALERGELARQRNAAWRESGTARQRLIALATEVRALTIAATAHAHALCGPTQCPAADAADARAIAALLREDPAHTLVEICERTDVCAHDERWSVRWHDAACTILPAPSAASTGPSTGPSVVSVVARPLADGTPCRVCATGTIRRVNLKGTVLPYREIPDLLIPADIVLPRCDTCREMMLVGEETHRLSAILEAARAERLAAG